MNGDYYQGLSDKEMIASVTYNLGGVDTVNTTVENIYNMENGTRVPYADRPTKITNTKIAIMYPSDYAYSMSSSCTETPISYDAYGCKSLGTWLSTGEYEWLLSAHATHSLKVIHLRSAGNLDFYYTDGLRSVRPVFYLKDEVKINGGTGTENDPYTLTM